MDWFVGGFLFTAGATAFIVVVLVFVALIALLLTANDS
jgi:hypothetical protein